MIKRNARAHAHKPTQAHAQNTQTHVHTTDHTTGKGAVVLLTPAHNTPFVHVRVHVRVCACACACACACVRAYVRVLC